MGLLRNLFSRKPAAEDVRWDSRWVLLPLGNPGEEYASTRHNLGRLLLKRWVDTRGPEPVLERTFAAGRLYGLGSALCALVPGTYMNLSGQVVQEALKAGLDPSRLLVLVDDKDLPLGTGRLRLEGSAGGHNGLESVLTHLGNEKVARLRLGIGPFVRPLHEFVLQEWTDEEWVRIQELDRPFAAFMDGLAACPDLAELPSRVNAPAFWKAGIPVENQAER